MKTDKEIRESIRGCYDKIDESIDNEKRFESVNTPEIILNYQKTRAYIYGWKDLLMNQNIHPTDIVAGPPEVYESYKMGRTNAKKWKSN